MFVASATLKFAFCPLKYSVVGTPALHVPAAGL
jgi:hypothetical protein